MGNETLVLNDRQNGYNATPAVVMHNEPKPEYKVPVNQYEIRVNKSHVENMTVDDAIALEEGSTKGGKALICAALWSPVKQAYFSEEEASKIVGKWSMKKLGKVIAETLEAVNDTTVPPA